jgi:hypothetical protein
LAGKLLRRIRMAEHKLLIFTGSAFETAKNHTLLRKPIEKWNKTGTTKHYVDFRKEYLKEMCQRILRHSKLDN